MDNIKRELITGYTRTVEQEDGLKVNKVDYPPLIQNKEYRVRELWRYAEEIENNEQMQEIIYIIDDENYIIKIDALSLRLAVETNFKNDSKVIITKDFSDTICVRSIAITL